MKVVTLCTTQITPIQQIALCKRCKHCILRYDSQ